MSASAEKCGVLRSQNPAVELVSSPLLAAAAVGQPPAKRQLADGMPGGSTTECAAAIGTLPTKTSL